MCTQARATSCSHTQARSRPLTATGGEIEGAVEAVRRPAGACQAVSGERVSDVDVVERCNSSPEYQMRGSGRRDARPEACGQPLRRHGGSEQPYRRSAPSGAPTGEEGEEPKMTENFVFTKFEADAPGARSGAWDIRWRQLEIH